MRKIETGRAGNQIYLTISNCSMRVRAHVKIWNTQEFWKTALNSFWRCSCDVLGPLRNQYSTTHLILTIFSCANEHLSRFGCFCFFFFLRFFGFSVHRTLRIFRILTFGFSVFLKKNLWAFGFGIRCGFRFFLFGFRFLLDLSDSFAKNAFFVYYSKWISTCNIKQNFKTMVWL